MQDITDEEGDALDEYFTTHVPATDPSKGGVTTRQGFRMIALDPLSEDYLMTRAIATHKTPTEIIGELVREKIASLYADIVAFPEFKTVQEHTGRIMVAV
ncbi:hypothetical protein AGMMS49579_24990 [Spirochaetia bacterium]|nr:hypothetical protein AGMMS49579_24990 [Spirochaetia bacterium]